MLTLFNIINYFLGKPLPFYVLVLLTVAIYYYVISTYWDVIVSNKIFLIVNIILLLIDITAIIMIFTIFHDNSNTDTETEIIKKDKKKKHKKNKKNNQIDNDKIIKIEDKNKDISNAKLIENNQNLEKKSETSILSLYEPEKDVSLNTYNKKKV
jgi:hypothetical protein